jgi:hypothetical protein
LEVEKENLKPANLTFRLASTIALQENTLSYKIFYASIMVNEAELFIIFLKLLAFLI